MKISFNWLKEYLDITLPAEQVAELLTNCGLEVEAMEKFQSVKGGLEGLVIGEVKTCEKHPNADKLSVTTVDAGTGSLLHIVCGAPNVAAGQKVIVALPGTTVHPAEGEPFEIRKSKIRGEVSEGMLCSEDEIGLGKSHAGLLVLDPGARIGAPVKEYFHVEDDVIFEIGLTPNRADAASHIGVARDLSAVLAVKDDKHYPLKWPSPPQIKSGNPGTNIQVEVADRNACPRYSGITMSGITVGESPAWLKTRLKSIGLNPINNIVDITNFVLHECGQPLHAFDADEIGGQKVVVRKAKEGEKFVTLDGVERLLTWDDLMICDEKEPMCIAGVFGGIKSGITEKTKNIFIESAYFNPASIRKTSKHHGLKTDASFRFERGTDPEITIYAMTRAAQFIAEIAGGKISGSMVDAYPEKVKQHSVDYDLDSADVLIGKKIEKEQLKKILTALQIEIAGETPSTLSLKIPTFKVDVTRQVDVVEEVLRTYGLNNIEAPAKMSASLSYFPEKDPEQLLDKLCRFLSSNGFHEILTNSLTRQKYTEELGFDSSEAVKILNPLSADLSVMRQSMLTGGLETISYNSNRQHPDMKLFEFGTTYRHQNGYEEVQHLALFITGKKSEPSWNAGKELTDFYYLKAIVGNLLKLAGIQPHLQETPLSDSLFDYGLVSTVQQNEIVRYGSVAKKISKSFDIDGEVFYADINWKLLLRHSSDSVQFREIPKFPQVRRDLSMIINSDVTFAQIRDIALKTEKILLKDISLFDVYTGDKIEAGKKSYAVSFTLQDERQTLTDKNIEKVMSRLMEAYEKEVGAVIRK